MRRRWIWVALALVAVRAAAQPASDEPLRGDAAINLGIAACTSGAPAKCVGAADEMDRLRVTERNGHTPSQLRARASELFDKGCDAGDGAACFELGKILESSARRGSAGDAALGLTKVDRACQLKHGDACLYLGDRAKTAKAALALFEQACAGDSAHGCEQLATRVGARDRVAALHHKACRLGDLAGCTRSAVLLQARGDRSGAAADLEAACDLGDVASCDGAGMLAGDPAHGRELIKRACDAEHATGCAHLADLVAAGKGGPRNWGGAIDLADHACELAKSPRCPQAAAIRKAQPDGTCTTEATCRPLCAERIGKACGALAPFVPFAERPALYETACNAGDGASCGVLGDGDVAPGSLYYAKGCKLRDAHSCTYAQYTAARGGSRAAREGLRRACTTDPDACVLLGLALEPTDKAAAAQLWRSVCAQTPGPACRLAAEGTSYFWLRRDGSFDGDALCWRPNGDTRGDAACVAETVRLLKIACDAKDRWACFALDPDRTPEQKPADRPVELPAKPPRWEWEPT